MQRECAKCERLLFDRKVAKLKQTNIKRWWHDIKGLSGVRCYNNWTQQMRSDQQPSIDAFANTFNRLFKPKESSGPDPISRTVWKEFAFELSPIIMDIYNASMIQGYVPEPFRPSDVVPVLKCSPPKSVEQDLRPISLTSQLAKIMEGFTLSALLNQVSDNFDVYQFALGGKSTTPALAYFLYAFLQSLDHGDVFVSVFFADFSKGFDLVDHSVLQVIW